MKHINNKTYRLIFLEGQSHLILGGLEGLWQELAHLVRVCESALAAKTKFAAEQVSSPSWTLKGTLKKLE